MSLLPISSALADGKTILPDEISFGSWQERPLTWRILDLRGTQALVICREVLNPMPFKAQGGAATWADSDVRAWLGSAFLQEAFSDEEREVIVLQDLDTPDSEEYGTKGCGKTEDAVFCLSLEEATALFATDDLRSADGENPCWWLRSPGGMDGFQSYVHLNGWINSYGYNVDEPSVCVRPAMVVDLSCFDLDLEDRELVRISADDSLVLASEYGTELMLFASDDGDYSQVSKFVDRFGMDASWESLIVERLCECAADGDAAVVEELFDQFGSIEYGSSALAIAFCEGNASVVRALLRKGYSLDGSCKKIRLVNDTPGLRKVRKDEYGAGKSLAAAVLEGEGSEAVVKLLVRQDALPAREYRLILKAAAKCDADLFEWMLNPDYDPLPGLGARWANRKVSVMAHKSKTDLAISKKALRMLWHGDLTREDPLSVKAMVPYLADPSIEDRQDLLNLMIREEWLPELNFLLSVRRMFTPNMLLEGLDLARSLKRKGIAADLVTLIKSIGAGSRLA